MRQVTTITQIELGKEFRVKIPNKRIYRARVDLCGTPVTIRCTSGTGIQPPAIYPIYDDSVIEIHFQDFYRIGETHTFIVDEQERFIKEYTEPPVKKSIAGLQYFRGEVEKSQESLNQKFSGRFMSFDQSFYNRTLGQIAVQYKYEQKYGMNFTGYSGAGFGALQMFSCALGISAEELHTWYTTNLYRAIRRSLIVRAGQIFVDIMTNKDGEQMRSESVEKEIRRFFKARDLEGKRIKRDLRIGDCKYDIYLPVWDSSRRIITFTRKNFPDVYIYEAACMAVLDPFFFRTKSRKRIVKEMGVASVDVVKNNDVYLKKHNPNLDVVSIGSPVRCFDKGLGNVDVRSVAMQVINMKHDTDLDWSRSCGSKRYECKPIDELHQFPKSENELSIAQQSGDIDV